MSTAPPATEPGAGAADGNSADGSEKKPPKPPAEDESDLISKTGAILEEAVASLEKTQGATRVTINLILNSGRINTLVGSVAGNMSAGGASSQSAAHPDASLPIAQWFQNNQDVRDAALMAAVAFLPGAPFGSVLAAGHRLADRMGHKAEPANTNPFSTGRAARLSRLGAEIVSTPDAGQPPIPVERLILRDVSRIDSARHYLWTEATDLRPALVDWLTELSESDNEEVAYTVGYAVGKCASVDLAGVFGELIQPWAMSEVESSRIAAGQALGAALGTAGARDLAREKVKQWSHAESARVCQRAVASLCRSAWVIAETEEAFKALEQLEKTEKVFAGRWVQQAVDTMWASASLFTTEHPDLAAIIVRSLFSWRTEDRSSIFYAMPQLHLALAVRAELALLRNEDGSCPLLLKLVKSDARTCRNAAALLGLGLRRKATRRTVRALLDKLVKHSHVRHRTELCRFLSFIAEAGTDDDRARLDSYLKSWRAGELQADLKIEVEGNHS